ncbi:Wings apart-like protein regulation of heterochromatin [Geosmithia morbida]|uniref:Wings apart-like protein regulation of heterochromatin n=1 Tax=Geosmithia morbida TaxID=1094350 RepID=A0A9P4YQF6_9HYPO|nr:Wings apart-like protein regulation of heterochromatin [Geosmithia morbida]KAF4120130.1 Wings apart-like protein regulation of heterochromatin [Geosmithia morbida]
MASRSAPRGAAQRKLVTYSKGSRDRKEKNAGTTADSTQVASSLYDFPDSDDAPSSPPRSKATPAGSKTPRPQPLDKQTDPGSESDMDYDGNAVEGDSDIKAPSASQTALLTPRSKRAALVDREFWARPAHNQARMSASKKVRQTYSQMRSIRSDAQPEGDILALSGDPNNDPLLSSPSRPNPGSFAAPADEFDFDNSDEDQAVTIKSVHELRRAGANNRFADEMEDLLSRIGTPRQPASLRRNALLELAQKLQRQEFSLQFRDHSARDTIAKNIGDEEDIISGFAMAASLVVFLSSNNAPNLLQQLVEEKIGELLGRLLRVSEDVVSIAGQRKTNLSKTGRGTVAGVKAYLQRMNIWHGYEPRELSPRSIALQLHHILQRNLEVRLRSDMIKNLEDGFASIAEDQAQRVSPDASLTPLVVLIMEAERGAAITVLTSNQLHRRASNIALFLKNALAMWPDNRGDMQSATLKLAIDTTNAEVGAEAFSSQSLLAGIARAARLGLDEVQKATQRQAFDTSIALSTCSNVYGFGIYGAAG